MHIITEPLRESCCVRCWYRWVGRRRELTRLGADARAKLRLGGSHLGQQHYRIGRAIKLSKTPFGGLAQPRMRQCASIRRGWNMVDLVTFAHSRRLSCSLKDHWKKFMCSRDAAYNVPARASSRRRRSDRIPQVGDRVVLLDERLIILLVGARNTRLDLCARHEGTTTRGG